MARRPLQYRQPKFTISRRETDAKLLKIVAAMEAASREAEADRNLSEEGRRAKFTESAVAPLKQLSELRALRLKDLEAEAARAEKIAGRAFSPEMSALEHAQAFELFREARANPKMREMLVDELTGPSEDPRTVRLRKFTLAAHPLLTGVSDAVYHHVRLKLQPTLPGELAEIEESLADIRSQVDHTEVAMDSIIAHADHEALRAAGALRKRVVDWTPEERAEFVETHGVNEFRHAIYRDSRLDELSEDSRSHTDHDLVQVDQGAAAADDTAPAVSVRHDVDPGAQSLFTQRLQGTAA